MVSALLASLLIQTSSVTFASGTQVAMLSQDEKHKQCVEACLAYERPGYALRQCIARCAQEYGGEVSPDMSIEQEAQCKQDPAYCSYSTIPM